MQIAPGKSLESKTRFTIVRLIAQGGMGALYEARQFGEEGFEKTVALKIIRQDLLAREDLTEMFVGEAKLVANLVHENIVQIYQLDHAGGQHYISMEYVNGVSLQQFIDRHSQIGRFMPIEICVFIMSRICRALEYAHTRTDDSGQLLGVVHRDICPSNIMITSGGVVKLTDFGIAKAVRLIRDREGEVLMGKCRYMSPEQARGETTDARSDLFTVGIVLWEMLSGRQLFAAEDAPATLRNVANKEVMPIRQINPNVAELMEKILHKTLARDRRARYQTASALGREMEQFIYQKGYGVTNVSLREYLADLFANTDMLRPENVQTGVPAPARTELM